MLRDITLGQFYQESSPIHRLDPRVKLVGTLLYLITLFLSENPITYGIAFTFTLSCIALSKVPLRYMIKGLRSVMFIVLLSALLQVLFTGGTTIASWWIFTITYEGIRQAVYMSLRVTFLVVGSSLVTYTTTPTRLMDGLESLLGFLRLFHVPVHELAMMMSIALRFIPILMEETNHIMDAQRARGADFESGNIFRRAKALVPILVPLFVSSLRRANELALAMEARGYRGGEGRTKLKPLSYAMRDYIGYAVITLYLALIIGSIILWPWVVSWCL